MKVKIFYSYSHKDERYREQLEKWLVQLKRDNLIEEWHDRKILPGDKWQGVIDDNLIESDIVIFLVSQDFLASESCYKEIEYAISYEKRVVPIILKTCSWLDSKIKEFQALPKDGKPVNKWEKEEDAWLDIYIGLKRIINEIRNTFTVKKKFIKSLKKVEFISQNKDSLTIDDIFVFPKIVYMDNNKNEHKIDSFKLIFEDNQKQFFLFEGEELSGKSTLAAKLFFDSIDNQYLPILIDGNNMYKTIRFDEHFRNVFYFQYNGDYDLWKSRENKIVIIDDYHHRISPNIMSFLKKEFEKIVIFMNSDEFLVYFKDDSLFADFQVLNIKPLNLVMQEQLIRKWKTIGQNPNVIEDRDIDKIESKINSIITKYQILPRYPFYILSILQTIEAFMPKDYKITAFGHCYQALITAQLIKKNISSDNIDTCFNFLTELSYDIYLKNKTNKTYTKEDYKEFKSNYKNKYIISDSLINKIESIEYPVLDLSNDCVKFEYPYFYYFFLGKKFADEPDIKRIEYICNNIHLKDNSFVLIFIIHHTHNQQVLDEILLHTMCSFDTESPAKLTRKETDFMDTLIKELPKNILSKKPVEENRELIRKVEEHADEEPTENVDEDAIARELMKGMKIIDILGQIAKNRAGSFSREQLKEILLETENLGFRILNYFLNEMKCDELKEWLINRLEEEERTKRKAFKYEQKLNFIEKMIQLFGFLLTIGMISKVSQAIGSDKLVELVNMIALENDYPSYELVNLLIDIEHNSINVDLVEHLYNKYKDSKNWWALQTLSYFLQSYMNTHRIDYRVRQKICNLLGLRIIPNITTRSS